MLRSNDCWRVQVTAKWINILLWTMILQLKYGIPFINDHDHYFLGFLFVCIILKPNLTLSLGYWWVLPFRDFHVYFAICAAERCHIHAHSCPFMLRDSWGSLHSVGLWDKLRWKRKDLHTQRTFPVCLYANLSILMFCICIILFLRIKV